MLKNIQLVHCIVKHVKVKNFWIKKCKKKKLSKISNLCARKCFEEKHVDLLFIGGKNKRHHVLSKDFKTFINPSLNRGRKYFCCSWLLFTSL